MKKILVINGHPDTKSLCHSIAKSYVAGARGNTKCTLLNLCDLKFDPILHFGYREKMPLEPDLLRAQELIKSADFIVFVFPNWWGTYPALVKGFIDRMWLPGFGFHYQSGRPMPEQLLRGKTGRIIVTMNTPSWFYRFIYKQPGIHAVRDCVMGFCGIKHVRTTLISLAKGKPAEYYEKILGDIKSIGQRDAGRV